MSVVPLDELGQCDCASSADLTAAVAAILAALKPTLIHSRITLSFGDSIIQPGIAGQILEVYSYTFSTTNTSGGSYTIGYSDNDSSNFFAFAEERRVGASVSPIFDSLVGQQTSNSWSSAQYTLPDGKAFAATSDGVVDVEFWYRYVSA